VIPGLGLHYNEVGHQAYERFDFKNAEVYHTRAVKVVPDNPVFLDNLGMVYLDQAFQAKDGRLLPVARSYFDKAIAANPRSLDPHMHMEAALVQSLTGDAEYNSHIYKQLIQNDLQLLAIDPYIPFARKNMADAYFQLGQHDRAFQELQTALNYEPNYVPGYLQFATWYKDLGDLSISRQYTDEAIAIVNKYRNYRPERAYEGLLLGRPPSTR